MCHRSADSDGRARSARPFQYIFGLGREPRVRQWLEPGSIYFGAGIGLRALEFEGTDNVVNGSDDIYDLLNPWR